MKTGTPSSSAPQFFKNPPPPPTTTADLDSGPNTSAPPQPRASPRQPPRAMRQLYWIRGRAAGQATAKTTCRRETFRHRQQLRKFLGESPLGLMKQLGIWVWSMALHLITFAAGARQRLQAQQTLLRTSSQRTDRSIAVFTSSIKEAGRAVLDLLMNCILVSKTHPHTKCLSGKSTPIY